MVGSLYSIRNVSYVCKWKAFRDKGPFFEVIFPGMSGILPKLDAHPVIFKMCLLYALYFIYDCFGGEGSAQHFVLYCRAFVSVSWRIRFYGGGEEARGGEGSTKN